MLQNASKRKQPIAICKTLCPASPAVSTATELLMCV
jgi:hypothetical protein